MSSLWNWSVECGKKPSNFCRAVLCCHVVSICLSVTFVYSVKTNKHIFKIFSPPHHSSFFIPNVMAIFRLYCIYRSNGGSNVVRLGVNCDFGWTAGYRLIAAVCFDSRRCSSVCTVVVRSAQLWCTSVYGTETATHQWICQREQNRIYLYAAVNLKLK